MSRLRDEVELIPKVGWLVAVLIYLALAVLFAATAWPGMHLPLWGKALLTVLVPLPLMIYVLLIAYVNRDAYRRGMRYVLWTLLAIFIPNGIGIILYFLLRDPLLVHCTKCGARVPSNFPFCPHCGAALAPACPQCRRPVAANWSSCPFCGSQLSAPRL